MYGRSNRVPSGADPKPVPEYVVPDFNFGVCDDTTRRQTLAQSLFTAADATTFVCPVTETASVKQDESMGYRSLYP